MANMCTYREPLEKHLSNARMALREWQDSASPSLQHLSAEERKAGIEEHQATRGRSDRRSTEAQIVLRNLHTVIAHILDPGWPILM